MALYVGEADSTMDDKNRLTIPKKFRRHLPEGSSDGTAIWVVPGYGDADFLAMDDEVGTRWAESITRLGIGGGKTARKKHLLGRSERVEVDKQGRALLPQTFLARCGIEAREFKITGNGDHLAVYSPASWERYQASLSRDDIDSLWDDVGSLSGGMTDDEI